MLEGYIVQTLILVALISGLPLVVMTVTSLLISIVQSATQIQEQSISYLIKLISVSGTIFLCSSWFWQELSHFLLRSLEGIALMGNI